MSKSAIRTAVCGSLLVVTALFFLKQAKAQEEFQYREIKAQPSAKTASLFITPVKEREEGTIVIDLVVEPGGEEVNAVETEINYRADELELISIDREDSFCQFFVTEDATVSGKIKLSCLAPYPGIKEVSNVYTISFRQKAFGTTDIDLSPDSLILANDGYGTNIAKEIKGQRIVLE
jgi:hypothetical protein